MTFTSVEIVALIFAIVVLLKLFIVLVSRESWISFVKGIYKNPFLLVLVELILTVFVFYYLLQELTIIQIMACVLLGALLTGMSLASYSKEFIPAATKMLKTNILKRAWLLIILWLVLTVWVLVELF